MDSTKHPNLIIFEPSLDSLIKLKHSPIYVNGKWCEIDTLQDLQIARKLFS